MTSSTKHLHVAMTTVAITFSMIILVGRCQVVDASSGCKAAQLCCRQKDNTCRVTGQRMNSRNVSAVGNSVGLRTCFCDVGCLELNDCCVDYRQHCSVVDCELSNSWSDWGECSVLCGLGVKERHRRVLRHAQNGGKACNVADTVQRAVCEGVTCKLPRAISPAVLQQLREIGRILPLSYARWRQSTRYNQYTAVRKHLFEENRPIEIPTSCANYEITTARLPCHKSASTSAWTRQLKAGTEVCVECQPPSPTSAMSSSGNDDMCRGRGVLNRETRWSAMTSPGCHGTWVMKTRWQQCSCAVNGRNAPAFIFV